MIRKNLVFYVVSITAVSASVVIADQGKHEGHFKFKPLRESVNSVDWESAAPWIAQGLCPVSGVETAFFFADAEMHELAVTYKAVHNVLSYSWPAFRYSSIRVKELNYE